MTALLASCKLEKPWLHITLYQPEIPGNVGAIMRLAAAWRLGLHLIEPLGFPFGHKNRQRASMDYQPLFFNQHTDWQAYCTHSSSASARLIAVTPGGAYPAHQFSYQPHDHLIFGSEGSGLPHHIIHTCHTTIGIPMAPSCRSINLAMAVGILSSLAFAQNPPLFSMSSKNLTDPHMPLKT